MKTKILGLTLALSLMAGGACFANPHMGTWELNEEKSKLDPTMGKNTTVVYEASGDSIKVTVEGVDKDGTATHNEWTGKFDGKDYPVTGDPNTDARSYKKAGKRTLELTTKKGDKVVMTGRIVVAADGKSRTVTLSGTNPESKKVKNTAVYDKQ